MGFRVRVRVRVGARVRVGVGVGVRVGLRVRVRVSLDRNAHLAHDASEVGGRDQRGRARVVVVVDALLLRARGRVGVRVVARVRASLELL